VLIESILARESYFKLDFSVDSSRFILSPTDSLCTKAASNKLMESFVINRIRILKWLEARNTQSEVFSSDIVAAGAEPEKSLWLGVKAGAVKKK